MEGNPTPPSSPPPWPLFLVGLGLVVVGVAPWLVVVLPLAALLGYVALPRVINKIVPKSPPPEEEEGGGALSPTYHPLAVATPPKKKEKPPEEAAPFVPTPYKMPTVQELSCQILEPMDKAIADFFTTVFDYYVTPEWAPYLTRVRLKLGLKQLLTRFAERVDGRYALSQRGNAEVVALVQGRLLPLALFYVRRLQDPSALSKDAAELLFPTEVKGWTRARIRTLTSKIIHGCMSQEEKDCKLWVELAQAVLADGVFWNIFELGRDNLPELVISEVDKIKGQRHVFSHSVKKSKDQLDTEGKPVENVPNQTTINKANNVNHQDYNYKDKADVGPSPSQAEVTIAPNSRRIPFLLDNFLDRKDSLDQPDPICSRWMPSLQEIIEETEFLYPLIQYLKAVGGQKALAFLQTVLDSEMDPTTKKEDKRGKVPGVDSAKEREREHCRRVLEVEYLPGFCRSHFFHESMGLSLTEQGTEVGTSPEVTRKGKTHSRSSSYTQGNKTSPQNLSDIFRNDGVVDGLPLYSGEIDFADRTSISNSSYVKAMSASQSSQNMGELSPDHADSSSSSSLFRKRYQVEDVIGKFFKSTLTAHDQAQRQSKNNTGSSNSKIRVGIEAKSFEELMHPEVNKRVEIMNGKCNKLMVLGEIFTSLIRDGHSFWLSPFLSSWLSLLGPILEPRFEQELTNYLKSTLSVELFVSSVDFVREAFISSTNLENTESAQQESSIPPSDKDNDKDNFKNAPCSPFTLKQSLISLLLCKVLDVDKWLASLSLNRDLIFLFFVDVLDILVAELFDDVKDKKERDDTNANATVDNNDKQIFCDNTNTNTNEYAKSKSKENK